MVDRQELRDKAKGVGSKVAGTFSSGAKAAKRGAKNFAKNTKKGASQIKDDVSSGTGTTTGEVEVFYGEEVGFYIVTVDDRPVETFETEQEAKAYARNLMREQSEESGSEDMDEEAGRFQQFATSFAQGVNDTVEGAVEGSDGDDEDEGREPSLPFMGQSDGDNSPQLAFMGDPDNDGNPEFAFMGDPDNDGDSEFALFESNSDAGNEPMLPGFGGQGDGGNEPMLPGFGGGDGDMNQPQLPGFGMDGGGNAPQIPGFGMDNEDSNDDDDTKDRFPWMM